MVTLQYGNLPIEVVAAPSWTNEPLFDHEDRLCGLKVHLEVMGLYHVRRDDIQNPDALRDRLLQPRQSLWMRAANRTVLNLQNCVQILQAIVEPIDDDEKIFRVSFAVEAELRD